MHVLVGASGLVGSRIATLLLARGTPLRVLVRNATGHARWSALGADCVIGDLKSPPSLEPLCRGGITLFVTASAFARGGSDTVHSVDDVGFRHLLHAAGVAGIRRIVYVSAAGAQANSETPLYAAKWKGEDAVRNSGLRFTILRPHLLMEFWLPLLVAGPIRQGRPVPVVGSGERRHSFISADDVAAFAVAAAADRRDQTLLLGGPEALSWNGIVAAAETALGRGIAVQHVPPGGHIPGLPDLPYATSLRAMLGDLDRSDLEIDAAPLYAAYRIEPTPVAAVLGRLLQKQETVRPPVLENLEALPIDSLFGDLPEPESP